MKQGTIDLIILIILFLGIQAWWFIPLIKKSNKTNKKDKEIIEKIKKLERIYKK